jgi:hypothetical protein
MKQTAASRPSDVVPFLLSQEALLEVLSFFALSPKNKEKKKRKNKQNPSSFEPHVSHTPRLMDLKWNGEQRRTFGGASDAFHSLKVGFLLC